MHKSLTVLVTSAGVASAVSVIKSLRMQKDYQVRIIAIDADPYAAGLFLADDYCISPLVSHQEDYIEFILSVCRKYEVNALFACYSKEISLISKHSKKFVDSDIAILLPSVETIRICDDKKQMSDVARECGLKVPKSIDDPIASELPVFSKKRSGSSSKGAYLVTNEFELSNLLLDRKNRLFQEYIEGDEYTVDILCDQKSNLIFAGPRKRLVVKSGQSVKGITVEDTELIEYCALLCKKVGMVGVCNAQFIKRKDEYFFIELNPRFAAGGLMLTVHCGANLPLAALKLMQGDNVNPNLLEHSPGKVMTRYWEEIIIGAGHENIGS